MKSWAVNSFEFQLQNWIEDGSFRPKFISMLPDKSNICFRKKIVLLIEIVNIIIESLKLFG